MIQIPEHDFVDSPDLHDLEKSFLTVNRVNLLIIQIVFRTMYKHRISKHADNYNCRIVRIITNPAVKK